MKYYVFEVSTGNDKIKGVSSATFDDLNKAVGSFHKRLGTAYNSDLYESDLVMVVNSEGGVHKVEKFINPNYVKPEVTPEA